MNNHLLQATLNFKDFKFALLCYVTAFVLTLIFIPPVISIVKRYRLLDKPNARKEHTKPIPTLGGISIFAGTFISLMLWFRFSGHLSEISFFLSMIVLLGVGVMDDLKDMSASYKLVVEIGLASLLAISGIRITTFGGLFGINELNLFTQYLITVVAVVGITNAFNLIDGIDGLAGGLGFMTLITLGIFLTLSRDYNYALIAFAWAGALLAFLYFNLNPAKIFMGDTGSLVLGFVIAILCVQLMKVNSVAGARPVVPYINVFTLGIVLIPVFDTLRVFGTRIWRGMSPFSPDKTHIHHLVTNHGFSHSFAARVICVIHGFILLQVFWIKNLKPEIQLVILFGLMLLFTYLLRHVYVLKKYLKPTSKYLVDSYIK
jgi:UDP-GlcNAc:undecaprenyl-phosphate/decaprenyl-phosphate GlcNAc-1-phosphate transferase